VQIQHQYGSYNAHYTWGFKIKPFEQACKPLFTRLAGQCFLLGSFLNEKHVFDGVKKR